LRPQGDKKGASGRQKREALRAIALRASAQGDMKDRPQGEPLEFISERKKDTKSGDVCSDGSFSS